MNRNFRSLLPGVVVGVLTVVLIAAGWVPAAAQVSKGSISGTVMDPQAALVADAVVKATSKDTNQVFETKTDSSGLFKISLLPVGSYRVEVSATGFKKIAFDNLAVSAGVDYGLGEVKLEVGEITSVVEVIAAAPLVQSTEAQISNTITYKQMTSFPGVLENQGLDNLALTVPGVVDNRDLGFSNTNGTGLAVNGLRGRNNDQQIDGQNNNDNSVGGPGLFVSNPEFVQEYQITTSNFAPEYGRNSGSVINVITKAGTNNFHGSIFGTESNSVLDSLTNIEKEFESLTKPARYNDVFAGGTIGGPIYRDRVFFFGGFDTEIISQKQVFSTGLLTPTPLGLGALAGCYPVGTNPANPSQGLAIEALQKYGPYGVGGGSPTPQNPAPTSVDNPPVSNGTRPDPAGGPDIPICAFEMGGVQRTLSTGFHGYDWTYKLDIQTTKNRFTGRYIYNKGTSFNTNAFGTAAAGYPANVPFLSQDYAFSWVRTLTNRMSNEARASFGRLNVEFGTNGIGNTIPTQGQIDQALTRVTFNSANVLGFGPATNAPQGRIVNTYQLQDNWSYFFGRHALKAGVNYTYQRSPNKFLPNINGAFRFTNFGTFGNNTPNRIQIADGDPTLDFREHDTFIYFGDDFKLRNNLTLNLGITWSYYGQPANLFHDRTVARESSSDPLWNPAVSTEFTTFPAIPAPKNSWGPSVGFAWSPHFGGGMMDRMFGSGGKTVIRGGYRLAYDPPFYNIYLNISTATPNVLLNTLTGASATGNGLLSDPFGPAVRSQLSSFLTPGVFDPRTFSSTNVTPDFGPQRTHQWSFGLQREITSNAVFEARYVGNHATRLFQSINGNPRISTAFNPALGPGLLEAFPNEVPSGLTGCSTPTTILGPGQGTQGVNNPELGRVDCNHGIVRTRSNTGFSDYNGLQLEFRGNNLWHQLTAKAGYTFSKTTDNASEIFSTFGGGGTHAFSQSQVNFTGSEHGLSGLHFPHSFFVTFSEEIPVYRSQNGVIGRILGGWAVSATYRLVSGQAYTPVQFFLSFPQQAYYDNAFVSAFYGTVDQALRPYLGSASAPVDSVGIFAGDACNFFGLGCGFADPTTLLSLNDINVSGAETVVTQSDVRFIANTPTANSVFGSPFGNVGRNILRDDKTNRVNLAIFKRVKIHEQVQVQWHMTMLNAFNHPNYTSIDPFIDDAGLTDNGSGFGNPKLFSGGRRSIRFGIKLLW